jgi:uncharacterized protein (TIGR03437 family)
VKQAVRLSCAVFFIFLLGASVYIQAQTSPDSFVTQVTTSTRDSYAGDISGNGRFVVIESTADIATEKTAARNNADGNREIFLFDYAQRRIFQITNTTSARVNTANPAISATNPNTDFSNIRVEVSNNRPSISNNGRWIAFSSNADTPGNFNGDASSASLIADGNQEIFIYFIPAFPAVDLTNGADVPLLDLTTGTFTRVTNTPASRLPTAGRAASTTLPALAPFVAFDNRDASVNDNASFTAFVSTRSLVGTGNSDGNPEIFIFNRTASTIAQLTATTSPSVSVPIFNENPSISGTGTAVAFISNANIAAGGSSNNTDLNAEVYLGSYDGTTATVTRQVTRTTTPFAGFVTNIFHWGRRISRDGNLIAFESLADLSGDNSIKATTTVFIYDVAANSFKQIGPRATFSNAQRFPTFTDYDVALHPATIVFSTGLNFRADGTIPTTASEGLNPLGATQFFASPVTGTPTFTRLTNIPGGPVAVIQPFVSNTRERIAFTIFGVELGGLNPEGNPEIAYLLSRQGTDVAGATLSFFTEPSQRPVTGASPTAPAVQGVSPGMLTIVRSATPLAPAAQEACPGVIPGGGSTCASETSRRPPLPIELNGVTVSINGAAAGLYFVSPGQINFVVPPGLAPTTGTNTYPVVINNNGTTIRSTIQVLLAQPDIFTMTTALGTNRAVVRNATTGAIEPFTVTTAGAPTRLSIFLTGVRRITDKSQVTVRIGTTDLTGAAIVQITPLEPGIDQIDVDLPASLAGAGDVPVIVTITVSGTTFTSRAADTAPRIRIN